MKVKIFQMCSGIPRGRMPKGEFIHPDLEFKSLFVCIYLRYCFMMMPVKRRKIMAEE